MVAELTVARSGDGGWEAWWQRLQCFFFRVKTSTPKSSPSLFFYFYSRFSPLYPCVSPLFLYFFSFSPLFSFLSFRSPSAASLSSLFVSSLLFSFSVQTPLLFCLPSSALFPCIDRKNRGGEAEAATVQPPQKQPKGHVPSVFSTPW